MVCTSIEQSKELVSMGILPETADMVYHYTNSSLKNKYELIPRKPTLRGEFWTKERIAKLAKYDYINKRQLTGEEVFDKLWGNDIPAWSFLALLSLLPNKVIFENKEYKLQFSFTDIMYIHIDENNKISYCIGMGIEENENIFDVIIDMINHFANRKELSNNIIKYKEQ